MKCINLDILEAGKRYTGKTIIERIGLRLFQDYLAMGKIEWVADDTFGNKLYLVKI